jgi:hypothetical protein
VPDEAVLPQAIVGAWEVDQDGELAGTFFESPNYRRHA